MVVVAGAGPAGATAARALALAGVPVRLIDRSAFPRNKPCGGAISMRVLTRFPYLEPALRRIATHRIARLHLEAPDGRSTLVTSDGPAALMIRRVEFDALLVDLAREAGADVETGVDVVRAAETPKGVVLETRNGRRIEADVVIAADGVHSVVARRLGLNAGWPAAKMALDMMEETPRETLRAADPGTLWVAYGYQRPGLRAQASGVGEGYAYVFPKRDHVNVGIGYVLDHYRRAVGEAPYVLQRRFVDELKRRGVMHGDSDEEHFTPFLIPVGGPLARPGRGRVLLAGDAGGFVNGFTAEGIYYAMVTGELAARTVAAETPLHVRTLASRYRKACDREIGVELRDSVVLQRYLFGHPGRIGQVVAGIPQAPRLTSAFLEYAMGRMPYRTLRRRLMASAPLLATRIAAQRVVNWVVR